MGFVDAVDPDLSRFKARGGKLLLYAGWGDTTITPENTVLYYESVLQKMGRNQGDFTRLFMVPGMAHCGGGSGPNTFDSIGALEAWREKGTAPAQITAFNPQTGLSRPVCPYPQYAKYTGTGNTKDGRELVVCRAVDNGDFGGNGITRSSGETEEHGDQILVSVNLRFSVAPMLTRFLRPPPLPHRILEIELHAHLSESCRNE